MLLSDFYRLKNVDLLTYFWWRVFKISFSSNYSPKRKRNCYRIDEEQMNVEITRGRSDIYDILTHLTFILLNHIKYEIGFYWTMLVKYPVIGWNYNKPFLSKKIDTCRKKAISHAANILEGLLRRCWISMMLLHQIPPFVFLAGKLNWRNYR
jgi:hypothetical protein